MLMLASSFRLALGACALTAALAAFAQEGRTRPVGYLVQTIPPLQSRSFSVPFDPDLSTLPGSVGRLTGVGSNYFENTNATWTAGAFSTSATPYFVRLTTGTQAGRTFPVSTTANTATRIFVSNDGIDLTTLGLAVGSTGTGFEIIPGDTLATFFGTTTGGDTLVLQGGATPGVADQVQIWSGTAWLTFYYNTTWERWARDTDLQTSPSRNSILLRSDRGLMITRRADTPLTLAVVGRVLTTPQRAVHSRTENSLTFLSTMQASDITLGALALQNSTHSTGWRGSSDPTQADILLVWGGTSWVSFYFNDTSGHWQRVGDANPNRDTFLIKAGTPVFVQRRTFGSTADDKTINFPVPGT